MRLIFLGAVGEVTGSSYLVETGEVRFLVDYGMFQGGREAEHKNRAAFGFNPETLDFVLLTHAHINHSRLLPRLAALGFRGPVYTTAATNDLLKVILKDSAHIQEKEAEWQNKMDYRDQRKSHHEIAPFYTVAQAEAFLRQVKGTDYDTEIMPHPSVRCMFRDASHILGSAIIEVWIKSANDHKKLVFSDDLRQPGHPIVRDPAPIQQADVLLVESTYGNRLHRTAAGHTGGTGARYQRYIAAQRRQCDRARFHRGPRPGSAVSAD